MIDANDVFLLRGRINEFSYLALCIVMLICEPVYGTYADVIKPHSNGSGMNMALGMKIKTHKLLE